MVEVKTVNKVMFIGADGEEFSTREQEIQSIVMDRLSIMFDDNDLAMMVVANKDKVIECLMELDNSA